MAAKAILARRAFCLMGGSIFVARLTLVHSLEYEFLSKQLEQFLDIIHHCGRFVFLFMSHLLCNQGRFNNCNKKYGTTKEWSNNHPIQNSEFNFLFSLYNPMHFLKRIRNNWVTEKTQALCFTDPDAGKTAEAQWKRLIKFYQEQISKTRKVI